MAERNDAQRDVEFSNSLDQIRNLKALNATWVPNFEYVVTAEGDIKCTVWKENGSGIRFTVAANEVDYYKNDIESLITLVTERIYESLFKSEISALVAPGLLRSVNNSVTIRAGNSL